MTDFYFATDGNWGGADGLVVVDADGLDEHFIDYADSVRDYDRAEWAEWFEKNNHPQPTGEDYECHYCDNYSLGTLAEIDKELEE
jgi:hypothetical protein